MKEPMIKFAEAFPAITINEGKLYTMDGEQ
jgi:hypothetical protein